MRLFVGIFIGDFILFIDVGVSLIDFVCLFIYFKFISLKFFGFFNCNDVLNWVLFLDRNSSSILNGSYTKINLFFFNVFVFFVNIFSVVV